MNFTLPYENSKFAADGKDIEISGLSESIVFTVSAAGTNILRETYNYDNEGKVRIRGIASIVSQCLYGTLGTGLQPDAMKTMAFYAGGTLIQQKNIYASRLRNPYDPNGARQVMAMARNTVCHPDYYFYLTFTAPVAVALKSASGEQITSTSVGSAGGVYTQNCDPKALFPGHYTQGAYMDFSDNLRAYIVPACKDSVVVRFLNRYDVMESLVAAYMEDKPSAQDDVSVMYGQRTRFDVKSTAEYTLKSGALRHADQFDTWHDLLTSRKAQILVPGTSSSWEDIVITKSNYTRQRRQFHGTQAEVSFQTANPYMTL